MIAAFSAILGTTVGGLTTFLTTFLNQRFAMRRDILAKDVANREQLYSEFLKEVGNLLFRLDSSNPRRHVPAGFADHDVFACRPHPDDQQ